MKYRNPKWNPIEWRLVVTALLAFLVWYCLPTSLFYRPTAVVIENGVVTVTRSFPVSPPLALPIIRYDETVRPLGGGRPCTDSDTFRYVDNGEPTNSWSLDWAARCTRGGFTWSARWTVKLWGAVPLRYTELSAVVGGNR